MKNTFLSTNKKLLYIIFIFFYGFYGTIHAADDVKILRDRYRASYNDFMQALKNNTDQENINQLAARYKADYATYQKVLKSLSSLNDKNNASIKPPSNVSYQSNGEQSATIKHDISEDMYKKPMRITNAPLKSPQGISEVKVAKIDSFIPTPLPSDEELLSVDGGAEKSIYIDKIKQMHKELTSNDNCYLKSEMQYILSYANKFPDLCALVSNCKNKYLNSCNL